MRLTGRPHDRPATVTRTVLGEKQFRKVKASGKEGEKVVRRKVARRNSPREPNLK